MARRSEPYEAPPDTDPNPVIHKEREGRRACGQTGGLAASDWATVTCDVCLALPVPKKRPIAQGHP